MQKGKFQVERNLTTDELRCLTESIETHGVIEPVIVDENGDVIDGHHRVLIADRLGISFKRDIRTGYTDDEKRAMAKDLNRARRHLSSSERREFVVEELVTNTELSNREIARRTGADHVTVGTVRADLEQSGEIHHFSERTDPRTGQPSQPAHPETFICKGCGRRRRVSQRDDFDEDYCTECSQQPSIFADEKELEPVESAPPPPSPHRSKARKHLPMITIRVDNLEAEGEAIADQYGNTPLDVSVTSDAAGDLHTRLNKAIKNIRILLRALENRM